MQKKLARRGTQGCIDDIRLGLGPVVAYEWLRATRRWTMYAWRVGFLLVLLGGLALVWQVEPHRTGPHTVQAQADLAKMFFGIIECVAVITILLAAPAATAGVICQERASGTLLDVLASDLTSTEVVLGKLAARLLPVLATIAAALPVLAITGLFGGIDPAALGGSFVVIVGLAVLGCALALSLSPWGRKTHEPLGRPVLVFFLFASAPRDDWFPYWVMMGSPVVSMTLLTRASIAPYALDAWPGVAIAGLCWTAAYAAAAVTLFGLTLLTFDRCLGRMPDVPGRPKHRRFVIDRQRGTVGRENR